VEDDDQELRRRLPRYRQVDVFRFAPDAPEPEPFPVNPSPVTEQEQSKPAIQRDVKRAKRRYDLAGKLNDNEKLIALLRFYQAKLQPPGEPAPAGPINDCVPKGPAWRHHATAARRILNITSHKANGTITLPKNYLFKAGRVGLTIWLVAEKREQFERLNGDLRLDDDMKAFAAAHPILETVRGWLRKDHRPVKLKFGLPEEAAPRAELMDNNLWSIWDIPPPADFAFKPEIEPVAYDSNSIGAALQRQHLGRQA
jgi:hypothetical protein